MGLDAVEIVMAIEEAFDIHIEDSEAEQLLTPRDVISLVALKTSPSPGRDCLTQRAFNRLRTGFIRYGGQKRAKIKPGTKVAELIARDNRRRILRQILDEIGVMADPTYVRPSWLVALIFIGSLAVGVGGVMLLTYGSFFPEMIPVSGFSAFALALVCVWLTKGMRYELDSSVATVGGFSRWLVARGPSFIAVEPGKWTREQIAARVREIVIEQLGCVKTYREDARFIEDLGVG